MAEDTRVDPRRFHRRLFEAAGRHLPEGATVVCGVSGGADSMALLLGLHEVNRRRRRGWGLHVAHLDHGLRTDSPADAAFVEAAAGALHLPFHLGRAEVAAEARRRRRSIEEAARMARYAFLETVAAKAGAGFVVVGHQADDQAETVLHRLIRGTGLRGLAGMPSIRLLREGGTVRLVRPLLGFRREELTDYLEARGATWRHDATNDDGEAATRNRIRHEVLPVLEALNPQARAALLRLAEQARRAQEAISAAAAEALGRALLTEQEGGSVLKSSVLRELPTAVRAEAIRQAVARLGGPLGEVGFERIEAAAEAALGDGARRVIEFPGGVRVERRGERWMVRRSERR